MKVCAKTRSGPCRLRRDCYRRRHQHWHALMHRHMYVKQKATRTRGFRNENTIELVRRRRTATLVFRREKRHTTFSFETNCLGANTISFRNRRVRRHFQVNTEGREALPLTGLGQGHEFQTPLISHRAYRYYTCCMIAASPRDEVGP